MPLSHQDTKKHKEFLPLSEREEFLGKMIVDVAYKFCIESGIKRFVI
jgi:hypothetical protein